MNINETDKWKEEGEKINSRENLEKVKSALEHGVLIVQHWFYRGSRNPNRFFLRNSKNISTTYLKTSILEIF